MSDMNEPIFRRNFVLEMRRLVDAETAEGPYNSSNVAEHIVRKLRVTDEGKQLLAGWLDMQAKDVLRSSIDRRDASIRAHARRTAGRVAFGDAAKRFAEGDSDAMGGFLVTVHVTADGLRKNLSEMSAKDLMFVANNYNRRAADNAMQAAFLEALAKSLTSEQRVADRFDEQRLSQMWLSISRGSERPASQGASTRPARTRTRAQS